MLSFDSSIEIAPNLVLAYMDKAKIFNLKGNYKEAKILLNKVLDLDSNNYQAYKRLAYSTRIQAYSENKPLLYLEAIKYLEHAIEINPDKADAYNDIGVIYIVQYTYIKAEEWLKKSLKMSSNEWGYVNLYLTYLFLNKSYPIKLEKEYFSIFGKNDTEQFSLYNLFKIIKNVSSNKYLNQQEIQEEIKIWYKKVPKHRHYYFNPLKNWIDSQDNSIVKKNLEYVIELIKPRG
jgi:tetratricopeptide (TPR) repeat protein